MIKLKSVSKFYYQKGIVSTGFSKVNISFNVGEFVAITGESGSGKSTLLNVISGLDTYQEGEMYINGEETSHYSEVDYEIYRKKYIGNIFQDFNLVSSYTVYQNIELVLLINGKSRKEVKTKVLDIISEVGLARYKNTKVSKLSGGMKQRVAIARCLAKDTPIIIADEPTGNLDSKNAKSIIELLAKISKNKLVIVVTHNYDEVKDYVTRKVVMNDGKVIEDNKIKKYDEVKDIVISESINTKFTTKLRLGIRNAYNILSKFLLLTLVYAFVLCSILGTYSSFKNTKDSEFLSGYNIYFNTEDADKRLIVKKANNETFTTEEIESIKNIKGVEKVLTEDYFYDNSFYYYNDEISFYGKVKNTDSIKEVSIGRNIENDNEAVVEGYVDDFYFKYMEDDILNKEYTFDDGSKITIVGIITNKDMTSYDYTLYVTNNRLEELNRNVYSLNNTNTISYSSNTYESYNEIKPSDKVNSGEIYISSDKTSTCKDYKCINEILSITTSNNLSSKTMNFKITKEYNKDTLNKLTGYDYETYNGCVFINTNDYKELYTMETKQISIFTSSSKVVSEVKEKLDNYKVFYLKDGIVVEELVEILNIFKIIVLIFECTALFFISYFIIKLILKSRNKYYTTIRMLGGTKSTLRSLLSIELFTIVNTVSILMIILYILVSNNIININYISELTSNIGYKEAISVYLILILISYLTSLRYSRKVFTSSVMDTYRKES